MKRFFAFVLLAVLLLGALSLISCQAPENQQQNNDSTPPENQQPENENTPPAGNVTSVGSEGLTYELNSQRDGYIVTGMGTCTDTRVVIPSTYKGLPVMSIAKGAFQAEVPPVVEEPSDKDKYKDKYEKASLSGLTFLSGTDSAGTVTEESPEANITEVVIPDTVMNIGDEAFYGCEELASFEVSNLISLIGTDAFKNTAYYLDETNWSGDSLYLEEYLVEVRATVSGAYTVREGTVNIASNAFEGCVGITSVSFPASLRFLGKMAFFGCTGITEIDLSIPGIQIEANAFDSCTSLRSVKIATNDVPNAPPVASNIGFGVGGTDEVFMPGGSSDIAFDPTADPDLIYSAFIGAFAFKDCTALTDITVGSNLGYIGGFAFSGCTSLRSVDISMLKVHDPSTVIVTPSNNHRWHMSLQGLFDGCTSLEEVKLPNGIQWLDTTFRGCKSLKEFTIPDTVKGLNKTFSGCTGLKEITIPESVIALSETFSGCTSLTEIKLHDKLVKIGRKTFSECDSLTSVYVPDSVTEIGDSAFRGNEALKVSVGKGVKTIGEEAINFVYAVIYRGTMAEWGQIKLHERWGGMNPNEDLADIICSDGTIVDGNKSVESMKGILLADGTVYGHCFGVTVKSYPDSRDEIVSLTLAEIEAELKASGAKDWRYVSAVEIAFLTSNDKYSYYDRIMHMARYNAPISNNKPQDKPEDEEGGSSGNTTAPTDTPMKAIMLDDGTLYVYKNGVTIEVKDGKVGPSDLPYPKISSNLVHSGRKDWRAISEEEVLEKYGEKIYQEILALVQKLQGKGV